jgi:hypothetical protein
VSKNQVHDGPSQVTARQCIGALFGPSMALIMPSAYVP